MILDTVSSWTAGLEDSAFDSMLSIIELMLVVAAVISIILIIKLAKAYINRWNIK